MHFLTLLYKNDYEWHFMNGSEISLKTMIKIWNFIPLLLLWLLKWIEELNKVLVSNSVCEKHRRYKAFQIKMKNGNFKCERKIRRCGNNLFKITLVYRNRMKKSDDKISFSFQLWPFIIRKYKKIYYFYTVLWFLIVPYQNLIILAKGFCSRQGR